MLERDIVELVFLKATGWDLAVVVEFRLGTLNLWIRYDSRGARRSWIRRSLNSMSEWESELAHELPYAHAPLLGLAKWVGYDRDGPFTAGLADLKFGVRTVGILHLKSGLWSAAR